MEFFDLKCTLRTEQKRQAKAIRLSDIILLNQRLVLKWFNLVCKNLFSPSLIKRKHLAGLWWVLVVFICYDNTALAELLLIKLIKQYVFVSAILFQFILLLITWTTRQKKFKEVFCNKKLPTRTVLLIFFCHASNWGSWFSYLMDIPFSVIRKKIK